MQRLIYHFRSVLMLAILMTTLSTHSMELVSSLSQSFFSGFSQNLHEQGLKDLELQIEKAPVIGPVYTFGKTIYAFSGLAYVYGGYSAKEWAKENHVEKEEVLQAVLQEELEAQAFTEKLLQIKEFFKESKYIESKYADETRDFLEYLGHKNKNIVRVEEMDKNYKNYNAAAGYCDGELIAIKDDYAATNLGNGLFTCAHEAAHYALRHRYHARDSKKYEKEADLMAAYTLCGLGLESAVIDRIDYIDSFSDIAKDKDDGKHPTPREEHKYLTDFLNANDDERISMIYHNMSKGQKQTGQLRLASTEKTAFYAFYLMDKYVVQSCVVQSWQDVIQQIWKNYYEKK